MKAGDLVKLKYRGNGQPGVGLIVEKAQDLPTDNVHYREYVVLWDMSNWSMSRWRERELVVIK
jgi:hypothetical protein